MVTVVTVVRTVTRFDCWDVPMRSRLCSAPGSAFSVFNAPGLGAGFVKYEFKHTILLQPCLGGTRREQPRVSVHRHDEQAVTQVPVPESPKENPMSWDFHPLPALPAQHVKFENP